MYKTSLKYQAESEIKIFHFYDHQYCVHVCMHIHLSSTLDFSIFPTLHTQTVHPCLEPLWQTVLFVHLICNCTFHYVDLQEIKGYIVYNATPQRYIIHIHVQLVILLHILYSRNLYLVILLHILYTFYNYFLTAIILILFS